MEDKKVNILGQEYEILYKTEEEFPKLKSLRASGLAELYSKQLIINIDSCTPTDDTYDNLTDYINKVVKHEIIHAFFHEAGLTDYCHDEQLVDWLALQISKINKVIVEVENRRD